MDSTTGADPRAEECQTTDEMTLLASPRERSGLRAPHRALGYLPATALVIDAAVMIVVGFVAALGRARLDVFTQSADVSGSLTTVGPVMLGGWLLTIAAHGGYRSNVFGAGTDEYKRVVNASLMTAGLVGVVCYVLKFELSRGFFLLAFALGGPALILGRFALRRTLHTARRRGVLLQRVLIAGSSAQIDEVAAVLRRERWLGYDVVGAATPVHDVKEETDAGIPIFGNADEVVTLAAVTDADVIFFAGGGITSARQMRRIVWELEEHHVQIIVAPSVTEVSSERIRVRPVGGLPLMHIDPPTAIDASRWGKRIFDLLGSAALLFVFLPLIAVASARIKLHDRGPVLFRQTRIGKDGHEFKCLKFRTMVEDAEALVADLQAQQGASALFFKMEDDPRITAPGRWLRRYSIDELPQLVNVLRGDMSLVGPRPQVAREVALYDTHTSRRLSVRPGMTGLWQVSGRNNLSTSEAVRLDLYYVDNWSMLQDLAILYRTLGAVMSSRGAY